MADSNADVVRSYLAAVGAGDMDAIRSVLADDVVFHIGGRNLISGDKHGPEEVVAMFQAITDRMGAPIQPELHDLLANDEHVIALVRRTLGGVDAPAAVVYHVAEGRITEVWVHELRQAELDEALSP